MSGDAPSSAAVWFALGTSALAGLSTGFGSAIACFARTSNTRFLGTSLGFSAGVMIWISFDELLPSAREELATVHGDAAAWMAPMWFLLGMLATSAIDRILPEPKNPHGGLLVEEMRDGSSDPANLERIGLFTALAIAIHNFPEGIATFVTTLNDPGHGVAVAIAVALHNVPEGISVAVPIYFATGDRRRSFWLSMGSGLAEPIGAVAAWSVLAPWLDPGVMGAVTAAVGGVMVFLAIDQLVPTAKRYDAGHGPVYGLIAGMVLMAATLVMLG